jgi:hypothetical protein
MLSQSYGGSGTEWTGASETFVLRKRSRISKAKLSSGQTDKSQKVSIGALNQETRGSNALSLAKAVVGAAIRAAVKP